MNITDSRSWGLFVLRIAVAVVFLVHGGQKLFVFGFHGVIGLFTQIGILAPGLSAVVVTLVESLGGLAPLLGIATRWAAILLADEAVGAIQSLHPRNGFLLPTGW